MKTFNPQAVLMPVLGIIGLFMGYMIGHDLSDFKSIPLNAEGVEDMKTINAVVCSLITGFIGVLTGIYAPMLIVLIFLWWRIILTTLVVVTGIYVYLVFF